MKTTEEIVAAHRVACRDRKQPRTASLTIVKFLDSQLNTRNAK
jgi:hypothetical protein